MELLLLLLMPVLVWVLRHPDKIGRFAFYVTHPSDYLYIRNARETEK
jgi:hypothetical protein